MVAFRGLRAVFIGASGIAIAALAACGPSPGKSDSSETASSAAPIAAMPAAAQPAGAFAPPIDPDKDNRPDRVKVDDFATRIAAQQDALVAADAAFIQNARTALQGGSPDGAHSALLSYQAAIQGQITALPQTPRLAGCFDRAKATGSQARDAALSALNERRDKIQTLTAVAYRPLSLADFGPLATAAAAQPQAAAQVKALLGKARGAVAGCGAAAPGGTNHYTYARVPQAAAPSSGAPAQTAAPTPPAAPVVQPTAPPPTPAQKSPTFFNRLKHAFSG
jgi:hypothetical protein